MDQRNPASTSKSEKQNRSGQAEGFLGDATQRAADAGREIGERAQDLARDFKEGASGWLDTAGNFIREQPYWALGIAAAAGYLTSALISPSRSARGSERSSSRHTERNRK